jgi:hypothetical protein
MFMELGAEEIVLRHTTGNPLLIDPTTPYFKSRPRGAIRKRPRPPLLRHHFRSQLRQLYSLVIALPFRLIAEDLVRLLHLMELFRFLLLLLCIFDFVRMAPEDELSMRTSDGGQRRIFGHP